MDKRLKEHNWADVNDTNDVDEAVCTLSNVIENMFNDCFPLIKVRVSSKDPPFMTPLVKHLCKIRNRQIGRGINPEVQEKINRLIRENQVSAVRGENRKFKRGTKEWWRTINKITGRKTNNDKVSSVINPGRINEFFQMINTDTQYTTPIPVIIPDGTRVPIVDENDVRNIMMNLKRTGPGPDGLPYWLWKDFAPYLAPTLTRILNSSLKQQKVPILWKLANLTPIPKELPFSECDQLRPISLTNIIMQLFEKLVFKQEISANLKSIIGKDQFAYRTGSNTTMAIIKCQHQWLKWLEDEEVDFVRVISFDFSKAFDSVPHNILCEKLKRTCLNPYITNWIIDFLTNRRQRVVVDGIETDFLEINRGVPQGTVIGPFLFSLMVNDISLEDPEKNLLTKFADDLTVSAPVKISEDSAIEEVKNIKVWASENRMALNMSKTWEMVVRGRTNKLPPPQIDNIERKSWLNLLGMLLQDDPCNWDMQVDNLLSKAASRMYILRVCRLYGYTKENLNLLFESLILSLFYYGIEAWGSALQNKYLQRIDKFFRRAYRFGYTLQEYKISHLVEERDKSLFAKIVNSDSDHILCDLLPEKKSRYLRERKHSLILPKIKTERFKRLFLNRCLFDYFN